MRQQLPESAGDALYVNDIQRIVRPGEEFDCPLLVPGCTDLESAAAPADPPDGEDSGDGSAEQDKDTAGSPPPAPASVPGNDAAPPDSNGQPAEDPPATTPEAARPFRRAQ